HASPDCLLATADLIAPLTNHLSLTLAPGQPPAASTCCEPDDADSDDSDDSIDDGMLEQVLEVLRAHNKHDFRHHKPKMLWRRLHRRMALNGVSNIQNYLQKLYEDDSERAQLCSDFLISVTDFFRDPESYAKLDQLVFRKLLQRRRVDHPVRIWVPGCASGEEAYSLAMLLTEVIEASGRSYNFIIFATDVDEQALARARSGIYPESIATDLSAERLRMFFNRVDDHYQVKRSLREHIVFAPQSVTSDPPYSHLDLISCRNLLIYLNAATQARLLKLFHFALNENGFLFLGSSETVGRQTDLFEPLSRDHRLFRRIVANRPYRLDFPFTHGAPEAAAKEEHDQTRQSYSAHTESAAQIARNILLAAHVAAAVLINRKLAIPSSYGPTGR